MNTPEELQYTISHEWVRREGDIATVAITDYAQQQVGHIGHLELPEDGAAFEAGDAFGTIWTAKNVDDLYTPVGGEVVEVNGTLHDTPETISEDPYGEGWIIRLQISSEGGLLSAEEH